MPVFETVSPKKPQKEEELDLYVDEFGQRHLWMMNLTLKQRAEILESRAAAKKAAKNLPPDILPENTRKNIDLRKFLLGEHTGHKEIDEETSLFAFRMKMNKRFSAEEVRAMCFDLGIDHENLPGDTKDAKIIGLIQHAERDDSRDEIIKECRLLRPKTKWEWPE
jgi:hypothetical protein